MTMLLSIALAQALTVSGPTAAHCSWDRPGHNPFMGDVVAAVDRYQDLSPTARAELKRRMAKRDYDDIATLTHDRIYGRDDYVNLRGMHFGSGTICRSVSRAKWGPRQEVGLVYCVENECLIVPTVCRNVSRVTRVLGKPVKGPQVALLGDPEGELQFDAPGAGARPDGLQQGAVPGGLLPLGSLGALEQAQTAAAPPGSWASGLSPWPAWPAPAPLYVLPRTPATPVTPVTPGAPTDPTAPVTPVTPGNPTTPVTPGTPTDPTTPVNPGTPTDPTTPVTPVTPVTPGTPTDPTTPVTPVTPTDPTTPTNPTTPTDPGGSTDPSPPVGPVTPVDPTVPVTPVDPGGPVTPVDPGGPGVPVLPAIPEPALPGLMAGALAAAFWLRRRHAAARSAN